MTAIERRTWIVLWRSPRGWTWYWKGRNGVVRLKSTRPIRDKRDAVRNLEEAMGGTFEQAYHDRQAGYGQGYLSRVREPRGRLTRERFFVEIHY